MRRSLLSAGMALATGLSAQPPQTPLFRIHNITLEMELHKQVCISGMNFLDNLLYLASERCPVIYAIHPENGTILRTVPIEVGQNYEMEGMTSYLSKLYLVSENAAAVYEVHPGTGKLRTVKTSEPLPPKSKNGDGMEGIAANEKNRKFYLLRERTENRTRAQIFIYRIEQADADSVPYLKYESLIELPLENPQWRYSDICVDQANSRLICLKSYSKGKFRQQFLEAITIDPNGDLLAETLVTIPVENFTETSARYKTEGYSMNLEGITIDQSGTLYIVSDNTSGKADCAAPAMEKTILLQLKKQ